LRPIMFDTKGGLAAAAVGAASLAILGLVMRKKTKQQPPPDGELVVLPEHLLHEAATLAAGAFAESPSYVYVAGGEVETFPLLKWMFYRNFWLRASTTCNRAVFENGRLVAFFMFVKPGIRRPTFADFLLAGIARMPFLFGLNTVRRLFQLIDWFDEQDAQMAKEYGPLVHLERVCVHPDFQGRGIGTKALQVALREADAEGLTVFLGTQLERNVTFYRRLGFEVVKTLNFPGYPEPNRFMLRRPTTPAT